MTERRAQLRLPDSELVMLSWEQGPIRLKQLGNVEDVSPDGIGVLVDHALPLGTAVTVSYGEGQLTGIVKHHSERAAGHSLGIEFDEASKDSALHFQPELLIRVSY